MLCTEEIVQQVWEKGTVVTNNDPKYWRQDQCGAWISRSNYGCQQSPFGWEINYIRPQTEQYGQDLPNLRPMQWKNNICKQTDGIVCVIKAVNTENQEI
jgi:hypothetical protein